ncbi:MAG: hypothetical protein P8N41_01015 [Alphaproteobacteria bacterium]|jgi:hypothetical protein|nr:hypothetical protein [Alphaproteobacteria bacterium]MDG1883704.1 hypothetical protein [Alphaproteobacteria bacterium]MDG2457497.1 hypothetical protein [Alphaproteobacteria bacterium]|tara:strand:- start:398 stop:772 length:375 start_codon:yes stop_codon:yes gene_type:complete
MFKSLIEKNERRSELSIMAQYLNTCFMISTVDDEYLVKIEKGIVTNVEEGPFVMPSYTFKLTASKEEWFKFLQTTPQPGSHDIIAMLRRKVLKFEGDLLPLMSHLLYFKFLLASLRPKENNSEN